METLNIYFAQDTELSEYEAINKGYRHDVFVKLGGYIFNLNVYTPIRLQQDFDAELETEGFFSIEPNLILVKETVKFEIVKTINYLYTQRYFNNLKAIEGIKISEMIKMQ